MKFSIRNKLFLAVSGLILMFVLLSWGLNNQFLEKYYHYNKKKELMESYRQINRFYNKELEEVSLEIEKLERMRGLQIIIVGKDFEILYNTQRKVREFRGRGIGPATPYEGLGMFEFWIKNKAKELSIGKPIIEEGRDPRLNSEFVNLLAVLDSGEYIFISTPVAAIHGSVQTANQFFLFTGIATIITGCILVYIFSRRFTKPILALNQIALRMSHLDFSQRYPVTTQDEIGELGKSINSLSGQLEKSISELRDANEKLRADIERERQIDEMRKLFISNVSHELKTPIALIQGYAEGLKVNVNEDEENKNFYCEVIMDEAYKMNRLVKQLLDLSQLESGGMPLEVSCFDIVELTAHVLKKNAILFKQKGIRIDFDCQKQIFVKADLHRVEQVLMNYLSNAVNYVDNKRILRISIEDKGEVARISVYNSGDPIPRDIQDKIWVSFFKADKARSRDYGGTGLGLAIVRAIQEAHHQNYGVNNVGEGVEFWFELAVAEEGMRMG